MILVVRSDRSGAGMLLDVRRDEPAIIVPALHGVGPERAGALPGNDRRPDPAIHCPPVGPAQTGHPIPGSFVGLILPVAALRISLNSRRRKRRRNDCVSDATLQVQYCVRLLGRCCQLRSASLSGAGFPVPIFGHAYAFRITLVPLARTWCASTVGYRQVRGNDQNVAARPARGQTGHAALRLLLAFSPVRNGTGSPIIGERAGICSGIIDVRVSSG